MYLCIYSIHRHLLQEFVLKKLLAKKRVVNIGKGEVKIAVLIAFYILLGVIGLAIHTRNDFLKDGTRQRDLEEFLICESDGSSNCVLKISTHEILVIVVNVLLGFLPVGAILINCDLKACRKRKGKRKAKVTPRYHA